MLQHRTTRTYQNAQADAARCTSQACRRRGQGCWTHQDAEAVQRLVQHTVREATRKSSYTFVIVVFVVFGATVVVVVIAIKG